MHLSPSYTGWLLPVEHVYELVLVVALLAVCEASGAWVLDRVGLRAFVDAREGVFVDLAVGIGAVGTVVLGLGAAGLLSPLPVGAAMALFVWIGRRELAPLPGRWRSVASEVAEAARAEPALAVLGALVVLMVVVFLVAVASAPPVEWDALMYHLRLPAQFLTTGHIHLPADSDIVSHVGPLHMLYVVLLMAGGASAPALCTAVLGLVVGIYVFVFARRLFDARTALLAGALLWGTTTLLMVAGTARVGVAVLLFTLAAHSLLLPSGDEDLRPKRILLAGLVLGLGFAVKAPAIVYAVALAPLLLPGSGGGSGLALRGVLMGGGFVAGYAPWLAKDWVLLGSPMYPYTFGHALEPWLGRLYARAGLELPPPVPSGRHLNHAFNLRDLFFHPQQLAVEPDGAYYYTSPALALLPLGLLYVRRRFVWRLLVPGVLYVVALLARSLHPDLRYLLPAIPPLVMVVAYTLVRLFDRLTSPRLAAGLCAAVAALTLLPTATTVAGWLRGTEALPHLVGRASGREYVDTHLLATVRAYGRMRQALEEETTPAAGRVLMLWEGRGFGLGDAVLEDPFRHNWRRLSRLVPADGCLEDPGFTYVLINTGALGWYERRGVVTKAWGLDALRAYSRRCLTPLWHGAGYILLRRTAAGGPGPASGPAASPGHGTDGPS